MVKNKRDYERVKVGDHISFTSKNALHPEAIYMGHVIYKNPIFMTVRVKVIRETVAESTFNWQKDPTKYTVSLHDMEAGIDRVEILHS